MLEVPFHVQLRNCSGTTVLNLMGCHQQARSGWQCGGEETDNVPHTWCSSQLDRLQFEPDLRYHAVVSILNWLEWQNKCNDKSGSSVRCVECAIKAGWAVRSRLSGTSVRRSIFAERQNTMPTIWHGLTLVWKSEAVWCYRFWSGKIMPMINLGLLCAKDYCRRPDREHGGQSVPHCTLLMTGA